MQFGNVPSLSASEAHGKVKQVERGYIHCPTATNMQELSQTHPPMQMFSVIRTSVIPSLTALGYTPESWNIGSNYVSQICDILVALCATRITFSVENYSKLFYSGGEHDILYSVVVLFSMFIYPNFLLYLQFWNVQ